MLRAVLAMISISLVAAQASARECEPESFARAALEKAVSVSSTEDHIAARVAAAQARTIYPPRFIRLSASQSSAQEATLPTRQDRWLADLTNSYDLTAGAPVSILTTLPDESRLYLFYVKRSDGEIRLIFPNIYEGPPFHQATEEEPAVSDRLPWHGLSIAGPQAPYLLQLSASPDHYVLYGARAGAAFIPDFEAALRQWFDPREPFPLMRHHKAAFAGFLERLARDCTGPDFGTQRIFIETFAAD